MSFARTLFSSSFAARAALIALFACVPALAQNQSAPAEPAFTIDDLLRQVQAGNPDVLAAQKKVEASRLRPTQESSLPDPTVSFGYTNTGNPIPFTSIGNDVLSNAGVSFSQEIPFPGKLKLRGQMAQQDAKASFEDYQAAQLKVASSLKQDYFQLHYLYKAGEILERNRDLLERFAKIAESRYSVGKAQQADVLRAQLEVSLLLRQIARIEQEKRTLKASINSLLGRSPSAPLGRPADYAKAGLPALEDAMARASQNAPVLKREQAMVERGQLAVREARKGYYPDFGVMGGYYNMGSMPAMYEFRFDVKVPLYFWRKQRAAVQEQAALESAARHQMASTAQSVALGLKETWEAARTSDELLTLYSKGILPQSTLALESSLSSYQVGTLDFLTLLTNFRSVLDYEMNYYEELAAFQKAVARMEELSGAKLM